MRLLPSTIYRSFSARTDHFECKLAPEETKTMITRQLFGRTGHESTRAIFGGAALSEVTQEEADRVLEVLLHYGVNHIDVAASYGDAELRIAPWLQRYPKQFFVATKTDGRTYEDAKRDIHRSLSRLGREHIDLIQLHNLVDPIDWDTALSPKGALEACLEAREQGLVRFIGVTGHGSQVAATHLRSLERFDFDTVMLPYNYLMMEEPTMRRCSIAWLPYVKSETSWCRRSRQLHVGRGGAATTPAPPGMSRSRSSVISTRRCIGSWRVPESS